MVSVYVALSNGNLLKYESQANRYATEVCRRKAVKRPTMKHVEGFSNPKTCTLRTTNIHYMTLANKKRNLWISHSYYIDVVSCAEFKVISDSRINVPVLATMCGIPRDLFVSKMASNDTQVFCLLKDSSVVLEFDCAGNCVYIIQMAKKSVFKEIVSTKVLLEEADHAAYHGNITAGNRSSTTSTSSLESVEDDHEEQVSTRRENSNNAPPVPPRYCKGKLPETQSAGSERANNLNLDGTSASLIPPKSIQKLRNTFEKAPSSPALPPRARKMTEDTDAAGAPPRPPKPASFRNRSTSCHQPGLSPLSANRSSEDTNPPEIPARNRGPPRPTTMFYKPAEKMPLQKTASRSLPNMYKMSKENPDLVYDFPVTSIELVEDSLWVGRGYGDICVLDIDSESPGRSHGQVIASMRDLNERQRECVNKEPILVKVGAYIATLYNIENDTTDVFEVASWDSHGVEYFRNIEKFWADLKQMEKKLTEDQKEGSHETGADMGTF